MYNSFYFINVDIIWSKQTDLMQMIRMIIFVLIIKTSFF